MLRNWSALIVGVGWLLVSALPASAAVLDGGLFQFAYQQFPFGSYGGVFQASGSLEGLTQFPQQGATVAFAESVNGEHVLVILGGYLNLDHTTDVAFLMIRSPDPIQPGTYPVDTETKTVLFGFVDDVGTFVVPENPHDFDWEAYLHSLTLQQRFVSATGSITLSLVTELHVEGTFEGLMVDDRDLTAVLVSNATIDVEAGSSPVEANSWTRVKSLHR